jgi:O-antigen ligase
VFGVGLKEGHAEVVSQIPEWWMELSGFKPPPDNYYLTIFLEQGVFGGLLWLVLLAMIVAGGYRQVMRNRPVRFMLVAAFLSIIGFMINIVTFDAMLIWSNMVIFWFTAGLLRGQYGIKEVTVQQ